MPEVADKSISLLVADDHTLLVDMIETFLIKEGDFKVARAHSFEETITAISSNDSFDIVLLDLNMPGMNGLQGVQKVIAQNAKGKVVLFSGHAREEGVLKAIEMGARGYIPKILGARSLVNAVRFIHSGEVYVPTSLASRVAKSEYQRDSSLLTSREMSVLRGICNGDTNKAIAAQLGMSEINVKMSVRAICSKLSVTNRTQVAMTAISRGLF